MVEVSPKLILGLIKLARPIHWVKNFGIFAALVFSGSLFEPKQFWIVFWAFWAFNLAASSTYILNDILDVERDRKHPFKKRRPIASGVVPVPLAIVYAIGLVGVSLVWAESMSHLFFLLLVGYILLQIGYSLVLKHMHIVDILVIATGFIIRVYAGAFIIDAHLSVWFLLCVVSVALFLASGKRRAELGTLGPEAETRKTLSKYSKDLLNAYVAMFGNAAWISWSLFTFFESPQLNTPVWLFLAEISRTASIGKLLMITIPFAIFGIMRYQSLIFEGRSEAPEKLLLTDKALVASVVMWAGLVVLILYGGVATYSASY